MCVRHDRFPSIGWFSLLTGYHVCQGNIQEFRLCIFERYGKFALYEVPQASLVYAHKDERPCEPVWPSGKAFGKQKGLGSIPLRFSSFFKKVVVCGHSLVTSTLTNQ